MEIFYLPNLVSTYVFISLWSGEALTRHAALNEHIIMYLICTIYLHFICWHAQSDFVDLVKLFINIWLLPTTICLKNGVNWSSGHISCILGLLNSRQQRTTLIVSLLDWDNCGVSIAKHKYHMLIKTGVSHWWLIHCILWCEACLCFPHI